MSQEPEPPDYVHGYSARDSRRLLDQAKSLTDLLLSDTTYPSGASVLEAGCGIGALACHRHRVCRSVDLADQQAGR
jgi:hypothetical protein